MAIIHNGDQTAYQVNDLSPTALVASPPLSDNSTQIATTAWVRGQGYGPSVGIVPLFADAEIPGGPIDGINQTFTLSAAPNPAQSLQLFYNGGLQLGTYGLVTNTITLNFVPQTGDSLVAYYRH